MKAAIHLLLLNLAILFICTSASAGVFLCNDTGVTLSISVGYLDHDDGDWKSEGWWNVEPRGCVNPLPVRGPIYNRYMYYFAHGSGLEYSGGADASTFCTQPSAFKFVDPENCEDIKRFRRIDLGSGDKFRTFTYRLHETQTSPLDAAKKCASTMEQGEEAFAQCWMRGVASVKQRQILDCVQNTKTNASLALCASTGSLNKEARVAVDCAQALSAGKRHVAADFVKCMSNGVLDERDSKLVDCALDHRDSLTEAGLCAGLSSLSPEQRRVAGCVADNASSYKGVAVCLISSQMSPEEAKLAGCVMDNQGSYVQMGMCAFGPKLTPEQQAFLECAITSGGQPVAYAGCVGTRLTVRELTKCFTDGIGGDGCFGKNNTIVQFHANAWKDVTQGPGPSNDLVGKDGAVMTTVRNAEAAVRKAEEDARRAVAKAAEDARKAAEKAAADAERARREAEKSAQKLVDDPAGAIEDLGTQILCGFC